MSYMDTSCCPSRSCHISRTFSYLLSSLSSFILFFQVLMRTTFDTFLSLSLFRFFSLSVHISLLLFIFFPSLYLSLSFCFSFVFSASLSASCYLFLSLSLYLFFLPNSDQCLFVCLYLFFLFQICMKMTSLFLSLPLHSLCVLLALV